MRRTSLGVVAAALLTLTTGASASQLTVGSGATLDLGTGNLDLGCADLTIAGTLSAGTAGFAQARDVTIDPTGLVNGDSAMLQVAGDWDNSGAFNAGTSTVQLVDGCGLTSAVIAGDTTFANLDMTTSSGKLYSFTSGSTQTVTTSLTLMGEDSGDQLKIRSTLAGSEAFLDLQGASQSAAHVDVQDNHAIGAPLELLGASIKRANTLGWLNLAVPALSLLGLVGLGAILVASGRRALRGRGGTRV